MTIAAPSLDGFLKVHGLAMSSFTGKTVAEALRMCGLDDRALSNLGDDHCARSLIVRGALIDRLARRAKAEDNGDHDDSENVGDIDSPKAPKKGKKAKPAPVADDEEMAEEPRDTTPDRHDPHKAYVSDDQILAMEIHAGYLGTPANIARQILYAGRVRRGEVSREFEPAPEIKNAENYPAGYQDRVRATAAAIIDAGRKARGEL